MDPHKNDNNDTNENQSVTLSHKALTAVPHDTFQPTLETLNLSFNILKAIPDNIELATRLTTLSLQHNQLTSISSKLSTLSFLSHLDLSNNMLEEIPPVIYELKFLQWLSLNNNKIYHLDPEISKLVSLQKFYLIRNKLTCLPNQIGQLSRLEKIYLSFNEISFLPSQISKLCSIQELHLNRNQLIAVPPEMSSLGSLTYLDLSHNRIRVFPVEFCRLSLRKLLVEGNVFNQQLQQEKYFCLNSPPPLLDLCCNIVFHLWGEDDQLDITQELKERLRDEKNNCRLCGKVFFGKAATERIYVQEMCGQSILVKEPFCSNRCFNKKTFFLE